MDKSIYIENKKILEQNNLPCKNCIKNFDNVICFILRKYLIANFSHCEYFESIEKNSNFLNPPKFS